MTLIKNITIAFLLILLCFSCKEDQGKPTIDSIDPEFGSAETLVTFEGMNLENIKTMTFSGQEVNFNNAYNSENALLYRVPTNIPLGDHEVAITTPGGTAFTNFKVTLEPPQIFEVTPESASPGDVISILGKNFFDPVEVYFFDSIRADIVFLSPDSLAVTVPGGIEKGRITLTANGGNALSPVNFFSINTILVNDFDGNGLRPETNLWPFSPFVNQDGTNAVQNTNPDPFDGNFLKLSGTAPLNDTWIGGTQNNYGAMGDDFEIFGISTDVNNTLLEMEIHNNGQNNSNMILILLEKDGSSNDFAEEIEIDWEGWRTVSIPLNRFADFNDFIVDPAKVRILKMHLNDSGETGEMLEVNIDNIRFVEIL